jgi:hypothetical protein
MSIPYRTYHFLPVSWIAYSGQFILRTNSDTDMILLPIVVTVVVDVINVE